MTHKIISLVIGAIAVISVFAQASSIPEGCYKALGSPFVFKMKSDSCTVLWQRDDSSKSFEVQRVGVTHVSDNFYLFKANENIVSNRNLVVEKKGKGKKRVSVTLKVDSAIEMPLLITAHAYRKPLEKEQRIFSTRLDSIRTVMYDHTAVFKVPKKTDFVTFDVVPLPSATTSVNKTDERGYKAGYGGSICPVELTFSVDISDGEDIEVYNPFVLNELYSPFFGDNYNQDNGYLNSLGWFFQFVDGNIEFNNVIYRKVE
ncbi:MAG: hypothetical protein HDS11_08220 [Bacteroides sp.]|nr:hypothetical protein [Bacteroides sp.]